MAAFYKSETFTARDCIGYLVARAHTLMRGRSRKLRKLLARLLSNAHAGLATFGNQTRKAVILAFARDNNMIEAPPSGSESLLYRVEAIENFHRVSVRVIKQRAA